MKNIMIGCLVLAVIAAVFYVLLGAGVISAGIGGTDATRTIILVAAGCYFLGGLLVMARKRWLWIIGLVMNTLVLAAFFTMYTTRNPAVIFSLPGLGTKIPQILLEAGLIYLIFIFNKNKQ